MFEWFLFLYTIIDFFGNIWFSTVSLSMSGQYVFTISLISSQIWLVRLVGVRLVSVGVDFGNERLSCVVEPVQIMNMSSIYHFHIIMYGCLSLVRVDSRDLWKDLHRLGPFCTHSHSLKYSPLNSNTLFLRTMFSISSRSSGFGRRGVDYGLVWELSHWRLCHLCMVCLYKEMTHQRWLKCCVVGSWWLSWGLKSPVVSFIEDGSCLTSGCSQKSIKLEIFSFMLLTLDTIRLIPIGFYEFSLESTVGMYVL